LILIGDKHVQTPGKGPKRSRLYEGKSACGRPKVIRRIWLPRDDHTDDCSEKKDLFESVIIDVNDEFRVLIEDLETKAKGRPLFERYAVAIDQICDFLATHPEVPNLILFQQFGKTKQEFDDVLSERISLNEVADAMGFSMEDREFSNKVKAGILAVWFSIFSFIAGEKYIRPMFGMDRDHYIQMVKDTMKRILIPGFDRTIKNKP